MKLRLVEAANNQPYVNAPVVLVFCMNPERVKMNFPQNIIKKFSQQDSTLAAAYSQLAAHALGLSSVWIGMIDEAKVMEVLKTNLVPSSILCIGYPKKMLQPKPKRNLKDLYSSNLSLNYQFCIWNCLEKAKQLEKVIIATQWSLLHFLFALGLSAYCQ